MTKSYAHRQEVMETQKTAQLYLRLGRYDAAEKLLKATLSELGPVANVHNLLGLTYHKQSKFAEAIVEFNRGLVANPDFVEAGLNLAATLCEVSRYEDAAAIFAQLQSRITHRKRMPPLILGRIANLHVESGRAYEDCGMYTDAVQEYRRAISLFDRMSDVRLRLAKLYMKLGQNDKAHRELEQLIKLDPQNSESHTLLGLVFYMMQKLDFARVHWQEAQKLDPFDSAARGFLAIVGNPQPSSFAQIG